jgi:hypothetical protein
VTVAPALLAVLLLAVPTPARAQQSDVPPVLSRAFALLQKDSSDAATALWSHAWTGPADSGKADIIRNAFKETREFAGPFRGYDIVKTEVITPHLRRIYILMLYERVPVYAQFLIYDPGGPSPAWQVQTVTWNTDMEKAWPASLWTH